MQLQRTFFGTLYRQSKPAFAAAAGVLAIWLLPTFIGFDVTPAFDWQMYARPAARPGAYPLYVLHYNSSQEYNAPHTFADHSRMMLQYTLPRWAQISGDGDTLPFHTKTERLALSLFHGNKQDTCLHVTTADLRAYPQWVKRYLQQQTGIAIRSVMAERIMARYGTGNRLQAVSHDTLFAQ